VWIPSILSLCLTTPSIDSWHWLHKPCGRVRATSSLRKSQPPILRSPLQLTTKKDCDWNTAGVQLPANGKLFYGRGYTIQLSWCANYIIYGQDRLVDDDPFCFYKSRERVASTYYAFDSAAWFFGVVRVGFFQSKKTAKEARNFDPHQFDVVLCTPPVGLFCFPSHRRLSDSLIVSVPFESSSFLKNRAAHNNKQRDKSRERNEWILLCCQRPTSHDEAASKKRPASELTPITPDGDIPQKKFYRQRAHCTNPLSHNDASDYPRRP
jgi:hypothetical protein